MAEEPIRKILFISGPVAAGRHKLTNTLKQRMQQLSPDMSSSAAVKKNNVIQCTLQTTDPRYNPENPSSLSSPL